MIATLIRMRVTGWRRTPSGLRWIGIPLGLILAMMAVGVGADVSEAEGGGTVLGLLFTGWLVGWIVGPVQSGGADLLRPEWFAMLPILPRRLAVGLLTAGFAGVGAVITLIALTALPLYGVQFGAGPILVGVVAGVLTAVMMVAASKLVAEMLGAGAKSRVVLEVTSLQYGLFVALMTVGWFALGQVGEVVERPGSVGAGLPVWAATLASALPSGWGVTAVEAAGSGNWMLAVVALVGLGLLSWLFVMSWAHLLERRMTGARLGTESRRYRQSRFMPATALGAVVGKDIRTWIRDPRRGVEVRSSLWASLFITVAVGVFAPGVLVFSGVVVVVIAAMASVNVYAMDGTALWYTLLAPGAIRADVRGRQLAWLMIFVPASGIPTVIGLAIAPEAWALPWVLALLPALLGGGAGLIVLLSIVGLVPETDAHKRSGNPAETGGDATGLYFAMVFGVPLLAAPPAILLALSITQESPALAWWAVVVGLGVGTAYAWGFGAVAIARLESNGAEYLQRMRVGPEVRKRAGAAMGLKEVTGGWRVGLLTTVSMISLVPQGLVALGFALFGADDHPSWFVALHLRSPWSFLAATGFLALGLGLGWYALILGRAEQKPA